ncbi:MAG: hypothetical protein ABW110_14675 [Steroidobacteraceae bacterium]
MHYSSGEAVALQQTSPTTTAATEDHARTQRYRVLRCTASLVLKGSQTPLVLKTSHITEGGLCVLHSMTLPSKQECVVILSALVNGQVRKLKATCRIGECVCAGDVFRISLTFTELHDTSSDLLARLLRG